MKLKEKIINEPIKPDEKNFPKKLNPIAAILLSAVFGFLAAGTNLGGSGAPLCTALASVIPFVCGAAAFGGALGSFFLNGTIPSFVTEIIAMPAVILARSAVTYLFGKKLSPAATGVLAASAYVICGTVSAFACKITAALILAIFFRGIICGGAAYFAAKAFSLIRDGFALSYENAVPFTVVYALAVCMLCGISLGSVNVGRTAGMFFTAVMAYRYGLAGGGAAGAVSAFAFGAAMPSMSASAAVSVCSGLVLGGLSKKSKLVSGAAFLGTAIAGSLIYGMPSDTLRLIPDMTIAAALFYVVPEKLYSKPFGRTFSPSSSAVEMYGNRLKFAASAVADVKECFTKAATVFERREQKSDIASEVCCKVCTMCRSSAFCGEGEEHRIRVYLRPAEELLEKKGFVTENELHKGLECCPNKSRLAETFNELYRLARIERNSGNVADSMREITVEQLSCAEDMLNGFGRTSDLFPHFDEKLSELVREALSESGVKGSAAVFADRDGRLYAECFFDGLLKVKTSELTARLCAVCDCEFEEPEVISLPPVTRLCFHEQTVFQAEIGRAAANGREDTSGDSDACFSDGFGNVYVLVSDGMGSGVRAAVESSMAVSLIMRIIRAGLGINAAVRIINMLLMTKSAEETFATVDLLKINLFTGKSEIVKLGAAQSFFKTNGTVKTIESWSTPVGIVSTMEILHRSVQLSDGDEAVIITDGICEECFPRVRELMLSMGVTAQECAERIIGAAENGKENNLCRQDDKTVYVVKMHKI